MRKLIAFITLFGVFMFAFVGFSTIKAFIIYEANYDDDSILQLPVAKKDALNLKEALSKIPDSQITLLQNPTAGEFIREFKKWINSTTPQDTLIVYYAGHGISKDGKFYFIPADADPEESLTWISFSNLEKYIKEDRKIVWLIDACYSGVMVKGRPLRAVRIQKEALHAQGNQVIITSSSGNEISHEMSDGSGGFFTVALVEALQGAADEDSDGWIESGELYRYVEKKVEELSAGQQHPMMKGKGNIKLVANISEKLKELDRKLFDLYFAGKLSELEYKNMKALIEGRSCEGEGVDKLKKGIEDYLSGKIAFDAFVEYVVKVYANKVNCGKISQNLSEEESISESTEEKGKNIPKGLIKLIPANDLAVGAKVYIDEKYAGKIEKPLFDVEVGVGRHQIFITSEKIEDIRLDVNIGDSETYSKKIKAELAKGIVKIDTDPPGADIYIDGKILPDKTPYMTKIAVGKHKIVIKKAGYVAEKRIVDIKKGQIYKLENINLKIKPERLNIYCPSYMLIGQEGYCTIKAIYKDRSSEEVPLSNLKVTIYGNAVVFLEGKIKATNVGNSIVQFEYRGVSEKREIEVYYGKLIVDSIPKGVDVYINGEYKGTTPLSVYLKESTVDIKLRKKGYEEYRKTITIEKGKNTTFSVTLSEKIRYIEANLPNKLIVGERVRLNIEAIGYLATRKLTSYEYNIRIEGNSVEYSSGYLIARKVGPSKVIISYKGARYERDIEVILGRLRVTSTPSRAKVYIDGKYVGTTPITVDVTKRTFPLNVSKQGYENHLEYVYFTPGKDKEIHVSLPEKILSIKANIPDEMVIGDEIKPDVEVIGYYSTKRLNSYEYKLYISDQNVLEYNNGKIVAKGIGSSTISVWYKNKIVLSKTIQVYYASVYILSDPVGANIYIDGKFYGTTPRKVYMDKEVRNLHIRLTKDGYQPYTRTVYSISKGDNKTITADLEAKLSEISVYYVSKEVELGDTIYKGQIRVTARYANGTVKRLSGYNVTISPSGALSYENGKIVARKIGTGQITVSYKGLTASTSIKVYKSIWVTSDPPDADVYTVYGEYLGKTPLEVKLHSDSQTIEIKKENYIPQTILIKSYQNTVHVKLHLPMENRVIPLLENGKIKEIAEILKINDSEKEKLFSAVRTFDETELNIVKCTTDECKLFKKYAIKYIENVKRAIEARNAKLTSELLKELYPDVSKELERTKQPWAWAFKKAFDENYESLSYLLEKNGLEEGAKYISWNYPSTLTPSSILENGQYGTLVSSGIAFSDGNLWLKSSLLSVGLQFFNIQHTIPIYSGFYVSLLDVLTNVTSEEGTPTYGGFSINFIVGKPVVYKKTRHEESVVDIYLNEKVESPFFWYLGIGIRIDFPIEYSFLDIQAKFGWEMFWTSASLEITQNGIYPMIGIGLDAGTEFFVLKSNNATRSVIVNSR